MINVEELEELIEKKKDANLKENIEKYKNVLDYLEKQIIDKCLFNEVEIDYSTLKLMNRDISIDVLVEILDYFGYTTAFPIPSFDSTYQGIQSLREVDKFNPSDKDLADYHWFFKIRW